jgi:hypothetical protein
MRQGTLHSGVRTMPRTRAWCGSRGVEVLGFVEHVLAEGAVVQAATAIELTWWKQPAPSSVAQRTAWRVPSTLAACWLSALAFMS